MCSFWELASLGGGTSQCHSDAGVEYCIVELVWCVNFLEAQARPALALRLAENGGPLWLDIPGDLGWSGFHNIFFFGRGAAL